MSYRLDYWPAADCWHVEQRDAYGELVFDFNGPLDACLSWIKRLES